MATANRKGRRAKTTKPAPYPYPKKVENNKEKETFFYYEGRRKRYLIANEEMFPEFDIFARFDVAGKLFYVASAVPEKLRKFMLIHEYLVQNVYQDTDEPHKTALDKLINEVVDQDLRPQLLEWLRRHYKGLMDYYGIDSTSDNSYHQSILQGHTYVSNQDRLLKATA